MNETNLKLSQEFLDEVLNGRDLDAMDHLIAEDFIELDPAPGQGAGQKRPQAGYSNAPSGLPRPPLVRGRTDIRRR